METNDASNTNKETVEIFTGSRKQIYEEDDKSV